MSPAIGDAENLTFDAHGNLWVVDCNRQTFAFTPIQLAAGGTQAPAIAISGGSILQCPWPTAFDVSGNAWVADDDNNHIVEYSSAS